MDKEEAIKYLRCCADIEHLIKHCHLCPFNMDTIDGRAVCANDDMEQFAKAVCKILNYSKE